MLFKKPLLEKILSGQKTQTRRSIKKKRGARVYSVGDKMGVRAGYTKYTAYVIITKRVRQKLGNISEIDAQKEGFSSIEEFKQIWIKLYGKWRPNTVVWVYEFKLAPAELQDSTSTSKLVQQATSR